MSLGTDTFCPDLKIGLIGRSPLKWTESSVVESDLSDLNFYTICSFKRCLCVGALLAVPDGWAQQAAPLQPSRQSAQTKLQMVLYHFQLEVRRFVLVILNGAQRSEESLVGFMIAVLRFFALLRMT